MGLAQIDWAAINHPSKDVYGFIKHLNIKYAKEKQLKQEKTQ